MQKRRWRKKRTERVVGQRKKNVFEPVKLQNIVKTRGKKEEESKNKNKNKNKKKKKKKIKMYSTLTRSHQSVLAMDVRGDVDN